MSRPPSRPRMSASAGCSAILPKRKKATKVRGRAHRQDPQPDVRAAEDETRRRIFVLQYVQPGLAGLMDGSVSTLAPLFAAAFATHQNFQTFLVGLAASIGAGISMGFAEALSDDGSLTGRGSPWLRGVTCGLMTTLGGLGHTMPYLVPDSWPTRSGSRPRSPASSCSSSSGRSPIFARATWIRRSCRRCSRSCLAASSCSGSVFSSARPEK